mmetsp:Transcript_310/g.323  ORF Transcript_310/g.323 Transcript_310/m.323 type:complete len:124 (-) Transcript_310:27-398(-)
MSKMKKYFFELLIISFCFTGSISFSAKRTCYHSPSVPFVSRKSSSSYSIIHNHEHQPFSFFDKNSDSLLLSNNADNNENDDDTSMSNGFDGEGFAGYLAPYALALIGSIVVTGAFFKFVLMDY